MLLLPGCFVPPKSLHTLRWDKNTLTLTLQKARARAPVQLMQKPCHKVHWVALPVDEEAFAASTHHCLQELVRAHLCS